MNTPQESWPLFAPKCGDASLLGQVLRLRDKRMKARANLRRLTAKPRGRRDRRRAMWYGVLERVVISGEKLIMADALKLTAICCVNWRIANGNGGGE